MAAFLSVLEYSIGFLLGIQVLYYLFFAIASVFKVKDLGTEASGFRKIAVFIPAYKEDGIIVNTAEKCFNQTYPKEYYEIVVLADSLKQETMDKLAAMPLTPLNVVFEQSTKAKSINFGLREMQKHGYDIAVVLDADNVMVPDFLARVNAAFNQGYQSFQGHRVAKNSDSKLSVLDGMSEEISNSIYRRGHRIMGLSASLAGSGMAFDYQLLIDTMQDINDHAAEDKLMQMEIAAKNTQILYDPKAVVFDEKVSNMGSFKNQRSRWLAAQFDAFLRFWWKGILAFFKGNMSYASFTFQFFLIPKTIFLGLLIPICILAILTPMNTMLWSVIGIMFFMSMLLATPRRYWNFKTLKALVVAPVVLFQMLSIVGRIRSIAIDKFVVTEKKVS